MRLNVCAATEHTAHAHHVTGEKKNVFFKLVTV